MKRDHIAIWCTLAASGALALLIPRLWSGADQSAGDSSLSHGSEGTGPESPALPFPASNGAARTTPVEPPVDSAVRSGVAAAAENATVDAANDPQVPPAVAAKYADMNGQQLRQEAMTLNAVYSSEAHAAGNATMADRSTWIDITDGVDEADWEGVTYTVLLLEGREYRIAVDPVAYPEVYELRNEVEWLLSESGRRGEGSK